MLRAIVAAAVLVAAASHAGAQQPEAAAAAAPAPAPTAGQATPAPVPAAAPAAAPAPLPPGPPVGADVVLVLKDGQRIKGRLVARDPAGVTVDSAGARLTFPNESVQALTTPGSEAALGPRSRDPGRTRYLYTATGFMLEGGEGYVSQAELIVTTVAVGLTDWATLQAGTVLPVLIYSPADTPLLLGLKLGGSATDWLHLAGGFQTLFLPSVSEVGTVGILYGTVTLGSEDLNLGVAGGTPYAFSEGTSDVGNALWAVSGTWRVGRSIALVSENWFIPVDGELEFALSGAVRFIGDRLGVNAGFIFPKGSGFPVPWLDFTWHWN